MTFSQIRSLVGVTSFLAVLLTACGGRPDPVPPAAAAPAAGPVAAEHPAPPALPVPPTVTVVAAQAYASGPAADPERHLLDLYLPTARRDFPCVVFVHGGGYQRGDRSVGHNLGVVLAEEGIAVAAISYRLYPQVRHPSQIEDVAQAVAWVRTNIGRWGGDPRRLYVSGHSAGAHLAALLATDGSYLAAHGLAPGDLAGVLALSGGYRINPIRMPVFGDAAGLAAASPFAHISRGHPPFLLLYGGLEKPERAVISMELRDALRAAGGQATCIEIPDRDHQGLLDAVGPGDPAVAALVRTINGTSLP